MASTNQSPQYQKAELMFLNAPTNEEKLRWLDEMIRECPKHKSAEKMLANLKTRRLKLREKIEHTRKVSKGASRKGIKKEELQAAIIGKTNSGKSSLISLLTNVPIEISPFPFATKQPIVGMMDYRGVLIQLIEIPAIGSEYFDRGIINTADTVIILINSLEDLQQAESSLSQFPGKKILVFNMKDKTDLRKLEATINSKKLDAVIISTKTGAGIEKLKDRIFQSFGKIRVYTKEPGKEKSPKPLVLEKNSSVKKVAEKILKGFSKNIVETKIWGPSSKFPGQKVGLGHELQDLDTVEFKTR